jgi:hypothetical protein
LQLGSYDPIPRQDGTKEVNDPHAVIIIFASILFPHFYISFSLFCSLKMWIFFQIRLKTERLKYWLSVGAQPSKRVSFLLGMADLIPKAPVPQLTIRNVPKAERKFGTYAAVNAVPSVGVIGGGWDKPSIMVPSSVQAAWRGIR